MHKAIPATPEKEPIQIGAATPKAQLWVVQLNSVRCRTRDRRSPLRMIFADPWVRGAITQPNVQQTAIENNER